MFCVKQPLYLVIVLFDEYLCVPLFVFSISFKTAPPSGSPLLSYLQIPCIFPVQLEIFPVPISERETDF